MSESDIIQRLQKATLYAGHGELSDLPEEAADTITALRAKVERLEGALKLFACDCTESSLCKFPHACPNYIASAALGDTHE